MSNFLKRTKRASEEIAHDEANNLYSDTKFLSWLHDVTALGYQQNIIISFELSDVCKELYQSGVTPEDAIKEVHKLIEQLSH